MSQLPYVPHGTYPTDEAASRQPPPPPNPSNAAKDGEILQPPKPAFSRKGKQDLAGRADHRISKRLRIAVGHVAQGLGISEAARRAGCHRNALGLALQRPHVVELLERTVKLNLSVSAGKAANRLDTLIDGARSEYVQLEASKAVLDRSGYAQASSVGIGGDVVIQINL